MTMKANYVCMLNRLPIHMMFIPKAGQSICCNMYTDFVTMVMAVKMLA